MRRSYALKFMLALFVLAATVGAVGLVGTNVMADEVQDRVHEDSKEIAQKEAQQVAMQTDNTGLKVDRISSEITHQEDVGAYLEAQHRRIEGNHHIHYVDVDDGTVLYSTNEELTGQPINASDENWAQEFGGMGEGVYENRSVHGGYYLDMFAYETIPIADRTADGTNVLQYQRLVDDGENRDKLVVVGQNMSQRADLLSDDDGRISFIVYPGAEGTEHGQVVLGPEGTTLYRSYGNERDFATDEVTTDPEVHDVGTPGEALAEVAGSQYADEEYVATAVRLEPGSPFILVVHTPKSEAYGFVQTVSDYGTYVTLGGVFLIVFVGGVIGRNTSRSIDRLRDRAERMEDGDLDVDLESDRIDSIGRLYDSFDGMRTSLKEQIRSAEEARNEAQMARERTERINSHLQSKADDYREVMRECAEGDLGARMDPESENEAMRDIAEEFNAMVEAIERTTARAKAFAGDVAAASEQVTASSEEVRNASEQVASSTQEISDGAEEQSESLRVVNEEMENLSTTTEEIAATSNEVADIAERTARTGQQGREAARAAVDRMAQIEDDSADAIAAIEELEGQMQEVDELIDLITDIAKETNMLALNANIEASRGEGAGDAGGGFGVVAEQVKELSAETKEAAEDIEELLEQIQDQTHATAGEVQQTADRIAENRDAVENAADALAEIADYAAETNSGVQEISATTEEQAASTQEVVTMVDEVATISQETTSEAENVAAAAEEQTTALSEVTHSASDLAERAAELSEALDRFETTANVDAGDASHPDGEVIDELSDGSDGGAADARSEESSDGAVDEFTFGEQ
ncbi:HAMP domain-containing protein [Halostella sp. JP-L12]|uniref:methyl-accepting chemotaxis protein n=1 Tax=Halostella TaxID=1843185 RepID=UPI0013CF152A|nr:MULTISPECIES: methyl-accepting chemotaxis protein [Halostella]NHN48970.1 HAMP domain-containing protein [Halostella sp. JP-L12]